MNTSAFTSSAFTLVLFIFHDCIPRLLRLCVETFIFTAVALYFLPRGQLLGVIDLILISVLRVPHTIYDLFIMSTWFLLLIVKPVYLTNRFYSPSNAQRVIIKKFPKIEIKGDMMKYTAVLLMGDIDLEKSKLVFFTLHHGQLITANSVSRQREVRVGKNLTTLDFSADI